MEVCTYFAIVAPGFPKERYKLSDDFAITPISLPMVEFKVTGILPPREAERIAAIIQWWNLITHILEINIGYETNKKEAQEMTGHCLASLLRIKINSQFCIPLYRDSVWQIPDDVDHFISTIVLNDSEHATLSQIGPTSSTEFKPSRLDFEWAATKYSSVQSITEIARDRFGERFSIALASMSLYSIERTTQMAFIRLFTALECLFMLSNNYKLAVHVAKYIGDDTAQQEVFNEMRRIITVRNSLVHKAHKIEHNIVDDIIVLRDILAKCLSKIIESGIPPNIEDADDNLFKQ